MSMSTAASSASAGKKKKTFLIAGIVLAVVAIVLVIVLVVLPGMKKNPAAPATPPTQTFVGAGYPWIGNDSQQDSAIFAPNRTQPFMGDMVALQRLQTGAGNLEGFASPVPADYAQPLKVSTFEGSMLLAGLEGRSNIYQGFASMAENAVSNYGLATTAKMWLEIDGRPAALYTVHNAGLLNTRNAVATDNLEKVGTLTVRVFDATLNTDRVSTPQAPAGNAPFRFSDLPLFENGKPKVEVVSEADKTAVALVDPRFRDQRWIYSHSRPDAANPAVLRHYYLPNPAIPSYSRKATEILSDPSFACEARNADLVKRLQNIGDFEDQLNLIQYAEIKAQAGQAAQLGAGFSQYKFKASEDFAAKKKDIATLDTYLNRFTATSADTDYVGSGYANAVGDFL